MPYGSVTLYIWTPRDKQSIMSRPQPNIVFVVIDALRFDRMGSSGYEPALTPSLDRFAKDGVSCSSNYAVGCPTQMAMPGIFTSSLPFDYGGYTEGIHSRPHSFVESLNEAGYTTFGVTTASHTSSHLGYGRGFDDYVNMFTVLSWLQTLYSTKLGEPLQAWDEGICSDHFIADLLTTSFSNDLESGLSILAEHHSRSILHRSTNYDEMHFRITSELELLRSDPLAVARKIATLKSDYHKALGDQTIGADLIAGLARRDRHRSWLNRYLFLYDQRRFYNARQVNKTVASFLDTRPEAPFFLYVHYFDLHDAKLLLSAANLSRLVELPRDVAKAAKSRQNFHPDGLLYDIGLSYTDRHFGQLVNMLESADLPGDTIYVVTADHGLTTQHPIRTHTNDLSTFFFEEWLQVPLIIHGPSIDAEDVSSLMSHLDIGPTILELADVESPVEFRGQGISSRREHPEAYVFAENCGRGRCDLDTKTLNIGIHNKEIKVVYQVNNFQPRELTVFDLKADPDEQHNLLDTNEMSEARRECERLVLERLNALQHSAKTDSELRSQ
jgi:arylsulfatase A-like enzyme